MATKLTKLTPLEIKGSSDKPSLIAAKPDVTVREALKAMEKHNITSLPIYSHDSDNVIVTIVNLVDVLNYIIREAVADEKLPNTLDSEKSHNLNNQIEVVMTLDSDRESYRMLKADANEPILPVLEAFSKGTHRSLVVDYTNNIPSYILTQTDIIRYVHANPESLSGIDINTSLESLGLAGPRNVITGKDNETALNVYRRMAEKSLTGIPIVNHKTEQLIGTLSVSNLRGLNYASINNLVLPVLDFLATLPNAESILNPITVTKEITLGEALKMMVDNHIHRLWVINEDKKVDNVISLTDLINLFTKI